MWVWMPVVTIGALIATAVVCASIARRSASRTAPLLVGGAVLLFAVIRAADWGQSPNLLAPDADPVQWPWLWILRLSASVLCLLAAISWRSAAIAAAANQRAVSAGERKYRDLVDGIQTGVVIHREHRPLFANPMFAAIHGYSVDQIMSMGSILELVAPADRGRLLAYYKERKAGRPAPNRYECRMVRRDGSAIWVDASIRQIDWDGGPAIQVAVIDITDRKQAELEAIRHRDELEALLDATPSLVLYKDAENRIIRANRAAAEARGVRPEEMAGTDVARWAPAQAEAYHQDDLEVLLTRLPKTGIVERVETAAGPRWVRTDKYPVLDDHGAARGVVVYSHDITESRAAEEALAASERRNRMLVESSPYCIKELDRHGRITSMNAAGLRMLGLESETQIVGGCFFDFIEEADRPLAIAKLGLALHGDSVEVEFRTVRGRVYSSVIAPLRGEGGAVESLMSITRDVTESRATQRALRAILEGLSVTTGEAFFRSLVRHIAAALGMRWALVAELLPGGERVSIRAFWDADHFIDPFEYDLAGTPCQAVTGGATEACVYPDDVQTAFPDDKELRDMGAVAYAAIPLIDSSGRSIGLIAMLHDRPIADSALVRSILGLFAARASAELERHAVERSLRASEQKFRVLTENNLLAIGHSGADGRWVYANPSLARLLEVDGPEALIGSDLADFLDDQSKPILADARVLRARGESSAYEIRVIGARGTVREVLGYGSPMLDEHGRLISMIGGLTDITERKAAELALQRSEKRFRGYFDLGIVGITISNPDRAWIEVNDEFCRLLGYTQPELMALTWDRITHPDDKAVSRDHYNRLIAGEIDKYTLDKRYLRKDGSEIAVRVSVGCTRREDGGVEHVIALIQDMTEHRASEQALRESRRRYQMLAEAAPVGIFRADAEGRCTYVNDRWARMADAPAAAALGDGWLDAVHPDDRERVRLSWKLAVRRGRACRLECRFRWPSGRTQWVYFQAAPENDEGGALAGYVATATDITERRRAEQRRRLLMRELDHRVKNNLASVLSLVSQAARSSTSVDELRRLLEGRIHAMSRAHEALAAAEWQSVELGEVVRLILGPYGGNASRIEVCGPEFRLAARCALPVCLAVHELAVNAVKHGSLSREGGCVRLAWSAGPTLAMEWTESGGPEVLRSRQKGSGLGLIEGLIGYELRGTVRIDFRRDGLWCRMDIPDAAAAAGRGTGGRESQEDSDTMAAA